jgi:transcriptional regulator with XRE-family HTH domain
MTNQTESKQQVMVKSPQNNPDRRNPGSQPPPKVGRKPRTAEDRRLIKEFGKRVRWAREELELTTAQIADMVGIHPTAWNNYEIGRRTPDLMRLPAICARLNVDISYLLTGSLEGVEQHLATRLAARHPELVGIERTASGKRNRRRT